jgi:hypothetical protein
MHSFLSQTENAGEVVFGLALAVVAASTGSAVTLMCSAALIAGAGAIVGRTRDPTPGRAPRFRCVPAVWRRYVRLWMT